MPPDPTDALRWRLIADSGRHRRAVARAVKTIHAAAATGDFVVSWSGGKDSTAMCHLVKSLYPATPVMVQFDDCDWPEKRPYIDRVADSCGWRYEAVTPEFSVWDEAIKSELGVDNLCAQSHQLTQTSFLRLLETKRIELGCMGTYIGLRAEEGKGRRMNLATRGELYQLKSGVWHCCPLGRWLVEDVFAYMVSREIEINPCYFHNSVRRPEQVRLSWALPTPAGLARGDMEHIRRHYPRQFQRLRKEMTT